MWEVIEKLNSCSPEERLTGLLNLNAIDGVTVRALPRRRMVGQPAPA
jgi:hypothetical protein